MTFIESIKSLFLNYFNYGGRSGRSEFWWVVLFMVVVSFGIVGLARGDSNSPFSYLYILFHAIMYIPVVMLWFRRCNDAGIWFGWYLGLFAINIISDITLFATTGVSPTFGDPNVMVHTPYSYLFLSFYSMTTVIQLLVALLPSKK